MHAALRRLQPRNHRLDQPGTLVAFPLATPLRPRLVSCLLHYRQRCAPLLCVLRCVVRASHRLDRLAHVALDPPRGVERMVRRRHALVNGQPVARQPPHVACEHLPSGIQHAARLIHAHRLDPRVLQHPLEPRLPGRHPLLALLQRRLHLLGWHGLAPGIVHGRSC
eukprot:scaffold133566_cov75-Phaeocystis_antarctica.AAC.2